MIHPRRRGYATTRATLLASLVLACSPQEKAPDTKKAPEPPAPATVQAAAPPVAAPPAPEPAAAAPPAPRVPWKSTPKGIRLNTEPEPVQSIWVQWINRKKFRFTLRVDGPCQREVVGVATVTPGAEHEIDEDARGTFFTLAYGWESEVGGIGFGVESPKFNRVHVSEWDSNDPCPILERFMYREGKW